MTKKLKVGILGLGRAGRFMHSAELSQYPELFEIAAGADHDPERHKDLPSAFANAKLYTSLEEMLANPELDLITVATRNAFHTPHAIQALEAGKYVVIEKPIAISYAQVLELKAAVERHPGHLFLRFNRRFEPAFNHVREIIQSGLLGNISYVKVNRHPGFVRRLDWQTLSEFKGGMLNNWGPHLIDQALQLLDSPVKDLWSDIQHNVAAGDADDQVKIILRGENGRISEVDISTTTTLPGPLYEVRGDRGSLVVPVEEKTIKMRYLDPAQQLGPLDGIRENFPLEYGNPWETLRFIEEEIPIKPANGRTLQRGRVLAEGESADPAKGYTYQDTMWGFVWEAIVNGKPYPVLIDEGVEVVRITEEALKASGYQPHESLLSGHRR